MKLLSLLSLASILSLLTTGCSKPRYQFQISHDATVCWRCDTETGAACVAAIGSKTLQWVYVQEPAFDPTKPFTVVPSK